MSGSLQTFDDIDEEGSAELNDYKPYAFREDKTEEGTLKWLNDNFHYLYMNSRQRLMSYRRFSNRFKNAGDPHNNGFIKESNRDQGDTTTKPKARTNFFQYYVELKTTQVSKQKQNPVFIPFNQNEIDDLNNADACNLLVRSRMKAINFASLMREQDRKTFKYGHSFAKIYWDPCAGPIRPDFEKIEKKYGEVPRLDEKGKKIGKATKYDAKLGDVVVDIVDTDRVFPERKKKEWRHVDFLEEVEFVNLAELQADYPNKEIKKEDYFWLDVDNKGYNQSDVVMKHTFYHRPTKHLEHGEVVIYVEGGILERITDEQKVKDLMPDGQLPFVPDVDIEVDDEFWGRPFLINIEQLANIHDLIQSGIARNIGVASHPKLLVPENSINLKQANNEYGVLQYRGPVKPEWLHHTYVKQGEFELQDRLEKRMDKQARVFEVSQGYVPNGITAYSAIRYLDDQEVQANSNTIEKRRERIKAIYWKVAMMMGRHYKVDDGRMMQILGENNEYMIESFKKFDFSKLHSVEIENVSALSDTRSGRISDIIDLNAANQKNPVFGPKEITKLLDLGLEDGFKEEISQAPTTAKTILEMLKRGEDAPAPEKTDDLVEMWMIFSRYVESLNFKIRLDKARKEKIQMYIKALEYLMMERATMNAAFSGRVSVLDKFPMFFSPAASIVMPKAMPTEPQQSPGAGQANPLGKMSERITKEASTTENGGME